MGFFNLHKPLQYKYKYIYYDPKKEAQQEREKKAKEQKDALADGYKPSIRRGSFREMSKLGQHERRSSVMHSNIRLVVIIIVLFVLMFWLLNKMDAIA